MPKYEHAPFKEPVHDLRGKDVKKVFFCLFRYSGLVLKKSQMS